MFFNINARSATAYKNVLSAAHYRNPVIAKAVEVGCCAIDLHQSIEHCSIDKLKITRAANNLLISVNTFFVKVANIAGQQQKNREQQHEKQQ